MLESTSSLLENVYTDLSAKLFMCLVRVFRPHQFVEQFRDLSVRMEENWHRTIRMTIGGMK